MSESENDRVEPNHEAIVLAEMHSAKALSAEIESLRRWKAEAMEVLSGWERVWEALGRPGPLGEFKSASSLRAVERLMASADK